MKVPSPTLLVLISAGALFSSAVADTVKLKSGDAYNGKIIRESDTEVVMDVIVAAGITDEKSFAKADVESFSKTTADSQLFETLKSYSVGPYSFAASAYPALEKPLEAFLRDQAASEHAPAVQTMLDTLKAEEERVKAGEIKWDNRWYTAEETEKNKYQLGAAMRMGQMKAQAARRDFIGALNTFAQLEKDYPGAQVYPEAVELAQNTLPAAAAEADRLQAVGKNQETQFNANINYVPEPQKSQMLQAWKGQVAAAEQALAIASKNDALKWKPLLDKAPKSFETFKATYGTEKTRLAALPLAGMRSSISLTQEAEEAIQDKKLDAAASKLNEAEKLWPANDKAQELRAQVAQLKKPTPTPTPSATPAQDGKDKKGKK
ncbi:MAG: PTPDL family protein [Chthoniobacteraceae bacterium]